jgi:uncharacterized protein YukE
MPYELTREDARIDPEKMREFARSLSADARDLTDVAAGMRTAVASMTFGGPAADRFQHGARSRIKDLRDLAERLADVARVVYDAAEAIDDQHRHDRREEEEMHAQFVSQDSPW